MSQTTSSQPEAHWRDWTIIGLRALFVIGAGLITVIQRTQETPTLVFPSEAFNDVLIACAIGLGLIALLSGITLIRSIRPFMIYALVAVDFVLAGLFVVVSNAQPLIWIEIVVYLAITGLLRLGIMLGGINALGIVAAGLGAMIYLAGQTSQQVDFTPYVLPLTLATILITGVGVWMYMQDGLGSNEQRNLRKLAKERDQQVREMRERGKALTELTNILGGTLNFRKVLEAGLEIGLKMSIPQAHQRTVAMILLYDERERLYVSHSRGFTQAEELSFKPTFADEGILHKALTEAEAVILNKEVYRDPSLKPIGVFNVMRSVVCIPLRARYDNFGVMIVASTQENAFAQDQIDTMNAVGVQITIALQNATLYNNLLNEKERIMEMEEDARKALVRDLHDVPTQTVSAVAMRLRIAQRMFEKTPQEVPAELHEIEQITLRAVEEIRHVLFKLRPLALESKGLIAALEELAEKMKKTFDQNMTVKMNPQIEEILDEGKAGALFYLIEEATNNARKYAEASLITVQGGVHNDEIIIKIADNGKGFDSDAVNANYDSRGSFGMVNMKERAELLNGTLNLKSVVGKGTVITITIPLEVTRMMTHPDKIQKQVNHTKLAVSARNMRP
ncbi:MAG: GAF domain-containing sensor histidine kinase [Anaerolineae bacterium]|jgi:signal transduction histidine kinase|nr:GAF domain-containing sensor histidine kinase [Anaerolineae bacterium]